MSFFNSIFSDDQQTSDSPASFSNSESPNPATETSSPGAPSSAWNFGSFINTITTRSETVIGLYRRDLQEFRTELVKETALVRDVATRAVKEFPSVVLARGKKLHLFDDRRQSSERSLNGKKYCWFDARMSEIQGDLRTYTEELDDLEDYKKWKSGFVLEERVEEIENLMAEVRFVERSYLELVPVNVDEETFWSRYFYKVNKLKQAGETRAKILKKAMEGDDEEDLSWDVDEEEDDNEVRASSASAESSVARVSDASGEKNGSSDSYKDSDLSIISIPLSLREEEELEWDEIDDVGSGDDNKVKTSSSSSLSGLRKRLKAADEDEDLSWDFEDDDEPIQH